MACQFTYCTGGKNSDEGFFTGMPPEMRDLCDALEERLSVNWYWDAAATPGWPSPLRLSSYHIESVEDTEWYVMSRTRPVADDDAGKFESGFLTEFVVCGKLEATLLSFQRLTPGDILLTRGRAGLWFEGPRWNPGEHSNTASAAPLDLAGSSGKLVEPQINDPSVWSQLAPAKGDVAAIAPFQYPQCVWLARREKEVTLGSDDGDGPVPLDPDVLLRLVNESVRGLAKAGERDFPDDRDWWWEVPWKVSFTTFALEQDLFHPRLWTCCWKGVPSHEPFMTKAAVHGQLFDLDDLAQPLDPAHLRSSGWFPELAKVKTEPVPKAEEFSIPGEKKEREEQAALAQETRRETVALPPPELSRQPPPIPKRKGRRAEPPPVPPRRREKKSDTGGTKRPGVKFGAIAGVAGVVISILSLAFGILLWLGSGGISPPDPTVPMQKVLDEILYLLGECEKGLTSEEFADYGWLQSNTDSLEPLLKIMEKDSSGVSESDEARKAFDRANEYKWILEDAFLWREKLSQWDLKQPITLESIPDSLARNSRNDDRRNLQSVVRIVNLLVEAEDPKDLLKGELKDWRARLQKAKDKCGPFFRESLEALEKNVRKRVQEKIDAWERSFGVEDAAGDFLVRAKAETRAQWAAALLPGKQKHRFSRGLPGEALEPGSVGGKS